MCEYKRHIIYIIKLLKLEVVKNLPCISYGEHETVDVLLETLYVGLRRNVNSAGQF